MTAEEFRSDGERVLELRTQLTNSTLQEALLVIHDAKSVVDVDHDAPELSSARRLSNLAGRADVIRELYEMATPLPVIQPEKMPTFGVDEPPPPGWTPI